MLLSTLGMSLLRHLCSRGALVQEHVSVMCICLLQATLLVGLTLRTLSVTRLSKFLGLFARIHQLSYVEILMLGLHLVPLKFWVCLLRLGGLQIMFAAREGSGFWNNVQC